MKKSIYTLFAIYFIFIPEVGQSNIYNIKDQKLTIPSPRGFTKITEDMSAVYRFNKEMVDHDNDELAYFISDSDVPEALQGEIPSLDYTFSLKVNKKLKNMIVSSSNFEELKLYLKKQNKSILDSIKSDMSKQFNNISTGVSEVFDINFAIKLSTMIPMDPHYESDNAMAHSMYINYAIQTGSDTENSIVSATSTIVNISGKVLFFYCYAPKDELEWTRTASKTWVENALQMNPNPPKASISKRNINWHKVIGKTIAAAFTFGLISLIFMLKNLFIKLYNKIKLKKVNPSSQITINQLFDKGMQFSKDENYQEALNCFNKVIGIDSHHKLAYYYIAKTNNLLGNREEVVKNLKISARLGHTKSIEILNKKNIEY